MYCITQQATDNGMGGWLVWCNLYPNGNPHIYAVHVHGKYSPLTEHAYNKCDYDDTGLHFHSPDVF